MTGLDGDELSGGGIELEREGGYRNDRGEIFDGY